jgi:putative ABC transport system permease protein
MPVLWRIAFRNIWEHKAKSLIIGTLIVLGVIVIVIGNAMIDSAREGLRKSFIDNFTGDVMIHGPSDSVVSIFGLESMDGDIEIPSIPSFDQVYAETAARPEVAKLTSMAVAYGTLGLDAPEVSSADDGAQGGNDMPFTILFGVDPSSYFKMFTSIKVESGRFLETGKPEIMVTSKVLEKVNKKYGKKLGPGDKVLITGFGSLGMRIREVEIVGLYGNKDATDASGGPPMMSYVDIDTARVIGGLTLGGGEEIKLEAHQTALLDAADESALFGEDMVDSVKASRVDYDKASGLLGDTAKRELLNTADTGAWNFILVRLKNSSAVPGFIASLAASFDKQGVDARVTNWQGAAGTIGNTADIIAMIFTIAIIIVAVVAVIIMMNTLVVSVIERTGEIGTMRALGAQRGFVRKMFFAETLTLSLFFGLVGSLLAIALSMILNACSIPAGENGLVQMLFGGKILHLVPKAASFVSTVAMIFIVAYLAHLYPVAVALKVQPVRAMQNE